MIFEYDENNLDKFENFKGGEKYIEAKMYFDGLNRFMIGHVPSGGRVGEHVHEKNSGVIYVISGNGMLFMMDKEKNFIKEVFIIVLKVINIQWLMIKKKILFILQLYLNNNSCLSRIIVFFKV